VGSVQVADEGRLVVQGRHMPGPVIPAASGRTAQAIQAVGQRRAGHRAEPAVADRELLCQVVIDGHVGSVVVTHDAGRVAVAGPGLGKGRGRAGDEAAHTPAGDLLVDRARTVVRVHIQGRGIEVVNRIAAPLVLVGELRTQAVDIRTPPRQGQVPEHVIEGSIFQHHDHDMVDLIQVAVGPLAPISSHDTS
jgi:hypothetical protein